MERCTSMFILLALVVTFGAPRHCQALRLKRAASIQQRLRVQSSQHGAEFLRAADASQKDEHGVAKLREEPANSSHELWGKQGAQNMTTPINGSEDWWSPCSWFAHAHLCGNATWISSGNACCCDAGFAYNTDIGECQEGAGVEPQAEAPGMNEPGRNTSNASMEEPQANASGSEEVVANESEAEEPRANTFGSEAAVGNNSRTEESKAEELTTNESATEEQTNESHAKTSKADEPQSEEANGEYHGDKTKPVDEQKDTTHAENENVKTAESAAEDSIATVAEPAPEPNAMTATRVTESTNMLAASPTNSPRSREVPAAEPATPIEGSDAWWTCRHDGMRTCESKCCCVDGLSWDVATQSCTDVEGPPAEGKEETSNVSEHTGAEAPTPMVEEPLTGNASNETPAVNVTDEGARAEANTTTVINDTVPNETASPPAVEAPPALEPIEGSEDWWFCWHRHMHSCGGYCCCNEGYIYALHLEKCAELDVPEVPLEVLRNATTKETQEVAQEAIAEKSNAAPVKQRAPPRSFDEEAYDAEWHQEWHEGQYPTNEETMSKATAMAAKRHGARLSASA
mmetsp:Transcript_22961/g.64201  ORF Transcript_22961/g.64201 Transcript_22961/m.64201 type:complete len:573 (-) Transcript_22961:197-1915(-)